MVKIILSLIIFLIFNFSAYAQKNTKVELSFKNLFNPIETHLLEKKGNVFIYNQITMSPERIQSSKQQIKLLTQKYSNTKNEKCPRHWYKLRIIKNGQSSIEKGCIYHKRFSKIMWAFDTL